jgi:type VI secretion system secreted protein VgrG
VAKTVKPRIPGPQTAFVVTPSGEEIFLDKLGRVSVQFYWDRERAANTVDNTWVRVAQPWAGNGWGTYFWPRKGDEVVVNFIDGDPDKPVVVGSVYNAVNVPKYALPDNSTRTGILTRSSKGGTAANANELRFEDKEGSEEIYINAEKDMNTNVENANSRTVGADETISVQGNRKITVQKNQSIGVTGNQSIAVQGNQTESIKGNNVMGISGTSDATVTGKHRQLYSADAHITYGGDLNEKVAANYSLQTGSNVSQKTGSVFVIESGQEVHVKGGMTVTVEAGMEICLKGAGGFISIGPSGVTIQGTMVLINSGGAAGSGSPGTYVEPEQPTAPPAPSDSGSGDSDS